MDNHETGEINIFLSSIIIIFVGVVFVSIGASYWVLKKLGVIESSSEYQTIEIVKGVLISFIGVLILSGIIGALSLGIQTFKEFLLK